ncbi:uncharacterized protein LOC116019313 [Ipomoea triloba]|uniref:uncharacterized protein LOC116019313 n=1 Tax=Ipomoea triloba TaxID=35885 RepID=UPI00125E8325|nr:uncharacterized protein LOC116019313 [Ipomoea triloba]
MEVVESTDLDFTNDVERIKKNWQDFINKKEYEISCLKESMAKSQSVIDEGDALIAKVMLLIDDKKSLIPPIIKKLEKIHKEDKDLSTMLRKGSENVEEKGSENVEESYVVKYKEDVAAFEAQLKRKSIHLELLVEQSSLIKRHRKNNSREIVEVAKQLSDVIGILTEARDALMGYK